MRADNEPNNLQRILQAISGIGRAPGDVKHILITHSDVDHVGCLAALKEKTGARVYASPIEAEAIAAGRPSRVPPGKTRGIQKILAGLIGQVETQYFASLEPDRREWMN